MAQAKHGDMVKVHYTGKLVDGTVFDASTEDEPLEFTIGDAEVIKGLEDAVIGMNAGESKVAEIPAENAFGVYKKEMVVVVDRSQFPADLNAEAGQHLEIPQEGGKGVVVMIAEVTDSTVTLDVNHPLAGKDLTLEIKLLEIA